MTEWFGSAVSVAPISCSVITQTRGSCIVHACSMRDLTCLLSRVLDVS